MGSHSMMVLSKPIGWRPPIRATALAEHGITVEVAMIEYITLTLPYGFELELFYQEIEEN